MELTHFATAVISGILFYRLILRDNVKPPLELNEKYDYIIGMYNNSRQQF